MSLTPSFSEPTVDPNARFADPIAAMPSVNRETRFWGEDGLHFGDLLDAINPLQHIPVVANVYRAMTGDEISPGARIAGGTLFGGPLGLLSSLFNTAIEDATGRDVSGHLFAMLPGGDRVNAVPNVAVASTLAPSGAQQQAALPPSAPQTAATAVPTPAQDAAPAQTNLAALAALQRDVLGARARTSAAPAQDGSNVDALTALQRDLAAGAKTPPGAAAVAPGQPLFPLPLPQQTAAADGPAGADGRKPGEYSAAELASIYRAYQRAAETGAPNPSSTRVEK